jgi:hypothetical protein
MTLPQCTHFPAAIAKAAQGWSFDEIRLRQFGHLAPKIKRQNMAKHAGTRMTEAVSNATRQ